MKINGNLSIVGQLTSGSIKLSDFIDVSEAPFGLSIDIPNEYLIYKIDNDIVLKFPSEQKIVDIIQSSSGGSSGSGSSVGTGYLEKQKTVANLFNRTLFPLLDENDERSVVFFSFNFDTTQDFVPMVYGIDKVTSFLGRFGDLSVTSLWMEPQKSIVFYENDLILPLFRFFTMQTILDSTTDEEDLYNFFVKNQESADNVETDITYLLDMLVTTDDTVCSKMDVTKFPIFYLAYPNTKFWLNDYKNILDTVLNQLYNYDYSSQDFLFLFNNWVYIDSTNNIKYVHFRFFDYAQLFGNQVVQFVRRVVGPFQNGDTTTACPLRDAIMTQKNDHSFNSYLDVTDISIYCNVNKMLEKINLSVYKNMNLDNNNIFVKIYKWNVKSLNNTILTDLDLTEFYSYQYDYNNPQIYINIPDYANGEFFVPIYEIQIEMKNLLNVLL